MSYIIFFFFESKTYVLFQQQSTITHVYTCNEKNVQGKRYLIHLEADFKENLYVFLKNQQTGRISIKTMESTFLIQPNIKSNNQTMMSDTLSEPLVNFKLLKYIYKYIIFKKKKNSKTLNINTCNHEKNMCLVTEIK